jgi:cell wall-associated NlpC family hydrolase
MLLTTRRRTYLAATLALILCLTTVPAGASPRSDKVARAQAVKGQIDVLRDRTEIAAERYNAALIRYENYRTKRKQAEVRLTKARKKYNRYQTHLNGRVSSMYRGGATGFIDVLFGAKDFQQFAATWDFLTTLNDRDSSNIVKLRTAKRELDAARRDVRRAEVAAAGQLKAARTAKRSVESQLAEQRSLLSGIESQIAALDRAEEARQAAAARASVSSAFNGFRSFPPPTRAPRSEVVQIAMRYLGAPYVYGAAGPNTFDCSGFTMFVYNQVGVGLPHNAAMQQSVCEPVGRSDLQPGDLVFFGRPAHHVGLYIGGGNMIHAPHTGDVVRIAPAFRSNFSGGGRP